MLCQMPTFLHRDNYSSDFKKSKQLKSKVLTEMQGLCLKCLIGLANSQKWKFQPFFYTAANCQTHK